MKEIISITISALLYFFVYLENDKNIVFTVTLKV